MAGTRIAFDINKARKTQQDLETEIGGIRRDFDKLSKEVQNTKKWWVGQSQKDFVRIFDAHQEEIVRAIGEWLKIYGELVLKFGAAYQKADASMFNG